MKESIIIKNLDALKEVEIRYIKPLTVFIDKSVSCKSTIMKIIVLMRYIYKMVNIRFYLKNAKITRPPFKLRFNSLLHDGLESMITAETEISCPMPTKTLQSDINKPNNDLVFFKESYVSRTLHEIITGFPETTENIRQYPGS